MASRASSEDSRRAGAGLWDELRSNRRVWVTLGRNLVPVAGVLVFGWSAGLVLFNYWFDGLSAVAAIVATLVPRALRETPALARAGRARKAATGTFVWALLLVIVGLPYWIVLIPLHETLLGPELWSLIRSQPSVWGGLLWVAASNLWTALQRRYAARPEKELKQALRWDVYLLMLRALAMFLLASPSFPLGMVLVMALVMTWLEAFPARALRATFGNPDRLWDDGPAMRGTGEAAPGTGARRRRNKTT
jgi:hypothetical protein